MEKYNTDTAETKVCTVCKRELPKTKVYFQQNGKYLRSSCKSCEKKKKEKYYQKNKEKFIKDARKRRKKSQKIKEKQKAERINKLNLKGNWKEIDDYEQYLISDDGKVYSKHTEKMLAISTKDNGYKVANLWKNNKGTQIYIHRLVMLHFSEETPSETVNHIDGDKSNNHISNLEWATYVENNEHARKTGLWEQKKNNPKMSMPVEQRDMEGNLIKVYPSFRQAERETGVDATSIGHAVRKGWNYGGYQWFLKGQYENK